MKYINEILAITLAIMLIIASTCILPMLGKVIFILTAILYGLENFVNIFKKLHENTKTKNKK